MNATLFSRRQRSSRARRGGAMVLAVFAVVMISGLSLAFLRLGLAFNQEQGSRAETESALLVAEAGLAEAVFALRSGGTGNVGTQALPARLGNALFWVEATEIGSDLLRVRSSAMCLGGRSSIEALVFHYENPGLGAAIFSSQSLQVASNVFIDSYDSAGGTYIAQLAAAGGGFVEEGAVVISNGDIQVDSSSELHGDVHPGPGGDVTVHPSADVSGVSESTGEPRDLPLVTAPAIASTGNYAVASGVFATLPAGDYGFDALSVANTAALTIEGPARIVVDDFILRSNSALTLDTTGGPVAIYVAGIVDHSSNSTIANTGSSAVEVAFYFVGGPGQVVDLKSNAQFHGQIYCAEGTVEISSNFEVYGSVVADNIILNSNVQIHYDEALSGAGGAPETIFSSTWRRVEFPVLQYRVDRRDPFMLIGLEPVDLPSPQDSHG